MQHPPKIKETGFLDRDGAETVSTISNMDSNYEEQLCINGVTVKSISKNKITIPISQCLNLKTAETKALIDSGTEGKFIDGTNDRQLEKCHPLKETYYCAKHRWNT